MADLLELSAGGTILDLLDLTKWDVVEPDEPPPDIERRMRSGCGGTGSSLESRKLVSQTIPLLVYCMGATADAAFTNRDTLLNMLLGAVAYKLGDTESPYYVAAPTYLRRGVDDQDPVDIWTVMDFTPSMKRKDLHGLPSPNKAKVTLNLDIICYPGQILPMGL